MFTDIIFDFFGTLVDYSQTWNSTGVNTSYEYLCKLGFKIDKDEYIKKFDDCFIYLENEAIKNKTEFHMYDLGKYFFNRYFKCSINENENKIFIDKSINDWNVNIIYFENICNFIIELSKSYRLSILSNTHYPDLIHRNLAKMNIKKYFFKIYTSVEIGIRKPNREIFEFILKDLKIDSEYAIFIGDNYNDDFLGAKTVNIKCYLIDKKNKYCESIDTRLKNIFELNNKIN